MRLYSSHVLEDLVRTSQLPTQDVLKPRVRQADFGLLAAHRDSNLPESLQQVTIALDREPVNFQVEGCF